MLYLGRVFRNNLFGERGTIDVLLFQTFNYVGSSRKLSKGLYDIPNNISSALGEMETGGDAQTVQCLITTSLGNAYNTGMATIPQIGTVGIVASIDDFGNNFNNINYVWLGGIYGNKQFGEKVILPNDDTVSDDLDYEDKTLIFEEDKDTITKSDYIKKGQFLIKTKTCEISDYDNIVADALDYKKIPGENTFVMNKGKSALRHNVYDDKNKAGFAHLSLEDDKVKIKRVVGTESGGYKREQNILIDDSSIEIDFINKEKNHSVKINMNDAGELSVSTTGNISVNCDKKAIVKVKGDAEVTANGKMKVESKGKMTIKAQGINLAGVIYQLAEDVKYLQTYGSPSMHATMPTSQTKITSTETKLKTGFETL